MKKTKNIATVFVDTNILKFSAVKKHVFQTRKSMVNWGGEDFETEFREPYTTNDLHKITNEVQKRDAVFLAMLAYAGISERLTFFIHREVELESLGLPGMASPSGRFFGCPLEKVGDPDGTLQSRTVFGGNKTPKEHLQDFVSQIEHKRFVELAKATGAYQGKHKPLNLNQALDAYHIWCAESASIDYFLTMDYKLQRVLGHSTVKTSVKVVTPDQLLRLEIPRLGFFGAIQFIWRGYKFAKPRVSFSEGAGWN